MVKEVGSSHVSDAAARGGRDILLKCDASSSLRACPRARWCSLPTLERRPRLRLPAIVARRIESLRQWRKEAAPRFGLEPGLLLPNRLITTVAVAGPREPDALASLDGVRRWRAETFGAEIIAALASS